jgi:hypothetical protein
LGPASVSGTAIVVNRKEAAKPAFGIIFAQIGANNSPPSTTMVDDRLAAFVVGDSYQVLDVIGEGAYGIVWYAYHNP